MRELQKRLFVLRKIFCWQGRYYKKLKVFLVRKKGRRIKKMRSEERKKKNKTFNKNTRKKSRKRKR